MLGARLAGGPSATVAEALAVMGVPFALVVTPGEDDKDQDEPALRHAPRLDKSPSPGELRRTILELVRHRSARG